MNHGAGVIVVRKDGAVLMQHRDDKAGIFYPDHWCYPAGSVEPGEDFKAAAKRELEEETGYVGENLELLAEEVYTRTDGDQVTRHIYWTICDEKQEIQCNEGLEMKFLQLNELKDKKLIPGQERLLKMAVELSQRVN